MAKQVVVNIPNHSTIDYCIDINSGLLAKANWLPSRFNDIVIITDNTVKKLYGNALAKCLISRGHRVLLLAFPAGENSKIATTKKMLEEKILANHYARDSLILALGGGIVGDMAGFIAATYMRGIAYIQIPTSLLAMIDSSVGGKTGINTPQGKNLVGAFWHPIAVITDTDVLKTLPEKQIIAGLVEAIKIFLTSDKQNFLYVEKNLSKTLSLNTTTLTDIIQAAVSLKSDIVHQDEKEQGLRMTLNFGHTIGHALEKISDYKILHGYAVAYGILIETKLSQLLGLLSENDFLAIEALFTQLGIKASSLKKYSVKDIIKLTASDKKTKAHKARYILLKTIGSVYESKGNYAHAVPEKLIQRAISTLTGGKYGWQ